MKKIAIFHNLNPGGALNILMEITTNLSKKGFIVDIYSHQNKPLFDSSKNYYFPIKSTKNSVQQTLFSIFKLNKIQKQIGNSISNKNYTHIFVFPCSIIQSPHILKYLPKENTFYFFFEPKREFYEKTSFDYCTLKRIISRIIRYPIKIIDKKNCQSISNIISTSYYAQYNLKKIYNKKSIVIYPGMKQIEPIEINIKNNHNYLSLGILTMLKGHHISTKLVPKVEIYGEISHENINKYLPTKTSINNMVKQKTKMNIYKDHTFFLANQIKEPFGLTTLEAISNNNYVLGTNEAGTSEIIQNGINGTLLPISEIYKSKNIVEIFNKKNTITFQKTCIIDWNHTTNQILKVIQKL